MAAFLKQFAPNRWAAMERMPEAEGYRKAAMAFAAARWRHLQYLQDEDPQLYEIKVRQLIAEDKIFGLLAGTRTPQERVHLRKQVRELAADIVKQALAERERRIARLRQELKAEEDRLEADRSAVDALVEKRTDTFIAEGPTPYRPDFAGHRPRRDSATRPAE